MLAPGRTFGRYVIVREIGRGGMGAVFEAVHSQLRKRVALKTLSSAALDHRSIERFLREGRAAASLSHPHVVDVWDVGVEDQTPYIVMELLEGEDLAARIAREAPLDASAVVDSLLPVLSAVAAMHDKGVVHRDLKPENIFIARGLAGEDHVKVLDFGVCLGADADGKRLTDGGLVGTPSYLSPEQIEGASGDPKSDQHALAVIAFEALCGRRPYEAPTLLGLLAAIRDGSRPDLRALRADLPAALVVAVERALRTRADERFEDVRAMARALLPFASDAKRSRWSAVFGPSPTAPDATANDEQRRASLDERAAPLAAATQRFGSPLREDASEPREPRRASRASPTRSAMFVAIAALSLIALAVVTLRSPTRETASRASSAASVAEAPVIEANALRPSQPTRTIETRVTAVTPSVAADAGRAPIARTSLARHERAPTRGGREPLADRPAIRAAASEPAVNNAPIVD